VYQMDVKSAFLYGKIEGEVYVCQPPGFEDPDFSDRVYKVEKTLYGLHQAPKAWDKGDILLVQVYVDDIIFSSTKKSLCTEFEKMMHKKFQMSSMCELTFFLRLQVKQKEDGIFISQDKYVIEILKKFSFTDVKTASTPMETQKHLLKDEDGEEVDVHLYRSMIGSLMYLTSSRPDIMFVVCACARYQVNLKVSHLYVAKRIFRYLKGQPKLGLWYPKDSPFDLVAYTDSDYARASLDRKSTTGVKNPGFFSKIKQIEIRHHFIRDSNEKKLIEMIKIHTEKNVADLLIKAFDMRKNDCVTEAFVRRDLQLEDADGVDCLPNATIFEQLTLMGDPTNIADEAVNEEPSMQLKELMDFCTKLQQRVLDLENTKTAQALEITSLNKRVKKKKGWLRTHKLKRLYRVGRSRRVVSSEEESLGDQEDASKQGRIDNVDADKDIYLVNVHRDEDMFGVNDLEGDEIVVESEYNNP
ncbi:putative ribonuclease H-like domain-containing protein, partial [Tanacetum coccineum]